MNTRPRPVAWDAATAIEALAAAGSVLWTWTPGSDVLRLTGDSGRLGLTSLSPECSAAAFQALTLPGDRAIAEELLKPRGEGTPVELSLRMRCGRTSVWRGVWLEDGLRAAGLALPASEAKVPERDTLTGALDRRAFLDAAAGRCGDEGTMEMVVADLDRLSRLNEALGHDRADKVLATLGSRLTAAFSEDALPARVGEDEFAIVLPRQDGGVARLRAALEQPLRIAGFDVHPTISIGSVVFDSGPDAPAPSELLRRAELALAAAKAIGRGGTAVYGRTLETDSLSRLALEADLRNAFLRGEIEPFYQPVVNLRTGAVAGFEALARWRHPRRGLVPPDEFLSLAQDMGLMDELGRLMMTRAARQLAVWLGRYPGAGRLFCSVNLSVGEIERTGLTQDVARVIAEAGLPRGALKLEVTEGDIMRDTERAAVILGQLKAAGASLALDDFGTGFSSLAWLARLPFDTLKIDRYFVLTMDKDEGSAKIVKSVVALGRDLSLEVVAEGVENAGLAALLLDQQCHYGQGYGYAPALAAPDAEVYLDESLSDGAAPIKSRSA